MIRKAIALLIITAFMIPAVIAEPAMRGEGGCSLGKVVEGYAGEGELKGVITSSGIGNFECQGQLSEDSLVPAEAIIIKDELKKMEITITPSGHFTMIWKCQDGCSNPI
jgi:hypothetical protein